MIIGTIGRLGTGKTLGGVAEAYRDWYYGKTIYSNIPLAFPHIPIRTPYDFIKIENGFLLGDELWSLADNRKSMSLLSDIVTILCIRSRRKEFDIYYTQQYLQIDKRIRFITDIYLISQVLDKDGIVCTRENKRIPEWLIQEVRDGDWNKLQGRIIPCRRYLDMYDTKLDPYTLRASLTTEVLRDALDKALIGNPRLEAQMRELQEIAEKSERVKKEFPS